MDGDADGDADGRSWGRFGVMGNPLSFALQRRFGTTTVTVTRDAEGLVS
jgi:hypothetical protein